jgi:hypothetical protein
MNNTMKRNGKVIVILALMAIVFGVMTIKSGGFILFGGDAGLKAGGDYVSFVLWFNFIAGFFYVLAGVGIFLRKKWSSKLSGFLAISSLLVFGLFGIYISTGIDFETRTVGAMFIRSFFWIGIFIYLKKKNKEV